MTRARTAVVLAVVAALAVVATVVVAVVTRDAGVDPSDPGPTVAKVQVIDPGSGARFEVPAADWRVRGQRARIFYADARGRPAVVVRGPAVFHAGYCGASPRGSYLAFVGFTRQSFDAWADAIGRTVSRSSDGSVLRATLRSTATGPCATGEVELAMVREGDLRVVLVADAGALEPGEVDAVLRSLELAKADVAH